MTNETPHDEGSAEDRYDKRADIKQLADVVTRWANGEFDAMDVEAVCYAVDQTKNRQIELIQASGGAIQDIAQIIAALAAWDAMKRTVFMVDQKFDGQQDSQQAGDLLLRALEKGASPPLLRLLRNELEPPSGASDLERRPRTPLRRLSPDLEKEKRGLSRQFSAWCRDEISFVEMAQFIERRLRKLNQNAATASSMPDRETVRDTTNLIDIHSHGCLLLEAASYMDQVRTAPRRRQEMFELIRAGAGLEGVRSL